jgi:hypothetical protein
MLKYMCFLNAHKFLNFLPQQLVSNRFLPGKLTFYGRVLKSTACVALVRKVADEIKIATFSTSFGVKKIK